MGGGVSQGTASGSRRGRRRKSKSKPMSEINITPFVDVMLVLLIIFMVAAPLLTVGVPVELPKTTVAASELIGRLRAIAAERATDKVFLRADGAVAYEQVVQVMGALNGAGFSNIGLVTESDGPSFDGASAPAE